MLFSLDHKLYAFDNDSDYDSVAGENQLLLGHFQVPKTSCENQFHLHGSELKIIYLMALKQLARGLGQFRNSLWSIPLL